ncbi:MAG: transposase [Planctomycetes bacterium]|nr:transposase [Planctomycetota bacterium]
MLAGPVGRPWPTFWPSTRRRVPRWKRRPTLRGYSQGRQRLPLSLFQYGLRKLFTWSRPAQCPRTLTPEEFAQLPATLTVRVPRFDTRVKGFRRRRILLVTTLLDPKAFPLETIAALYRDRWTVELRIHEVKTTLGMEILRGESEDIVRKDIYMRFLAYDLIRALMWQAAQAHEQPLHRLSFAGTLQRFQAVAPYLGLLAGTPEAAGLYQRLLGVDCPRSLAGATGTHRASRRQATPETLRPAHPSEEGDAENPVTVKLPWLIFMPSYRTPLVQPGKTKPNFPAGAPTALSGRIVDGGGPT